MLYASGNHNSGYLVYVSAHVGPRWLRGMRRGCLYIKGVISNPGHSFHRSNRPQTSRIPSANAIVSFLFPYLSSSSSFCATNSPGSTHQGEELDTFGDHRERFLIVITTTLATWWVIQSSCEFLVHRWISLAGPFSCYYTFSWLFIYLCSFFLE